MILTRPGFTFICECPPETSLKNYGDREIYVYAPSLQGPCVIRDNDLLPLAAVVAS